jgi:hypothetical protein
LAERGNSISEHLLCQILRTVMVAGAPTQISVHLPVVAAERLIGDIVHTCLLEHPPGK